MPTATKPPPPTPGAGDKTKRAEIDRLRSGRDVFKEKYEAAQVRLAESERRAAVFEARLAAKSEAGASPAATTADFAGLSKRLEEVTASCENVIAQQRERFKAKLAASKSQAAVCASAFRDQRISLEAELAAL